MNSTNKEQNESTSVSKSSGIGKSDKEFSKYTSETTNSISNPLLNNQKNNLPTQSVPFHKAGNGQHLNHISQLRDNGVSVGENSVPHKSIDYMTLADSDLSRILYQVPSINGFYFQRIKNPSFTINQSAVRTNKTNLYAIPSSSIILPSVTDNIAVLNNPTIVVNQSIMGGASNQSVVNQQEATSKSNVFANTTTAGNNLNNVSSPM